MVDAVSVALSGLLAQGQRLAASANNIANAGTSGRIPTAENPASTVYRPLDVSYTALTAGVRATVTEDPDGYSPVFSPTSPFANEEGFIAVPNVDLVKESVNALQSKMLYKANLGVIKAEREMLDALMNTLA